MKREQVLLGKFALIMTFYYMGSAFTYSLLIPYLTSLGYDTVQQGWMFAFGAILTIIGQFLTGYLCDRYQTDKKVFVAVLLLWAVVNWLLYTASNSASILVVLWLGLLCSLFVVCNGVLDTWTIESDEYCLNNYGWIRAFGAIGFAVGTLFTSYCFDHWGYGSLGTAFFVFTIITLVIMVFIPDAIKVTTESRIKLKDINELLLNKNFILLTVIFLFLNIAMTADGYSTNYKIIELGKSIGLSEDITNWQVNFKWSFQAICELPLFFAGSWLVKKLGNVRVLLLASGALIVRFVLYAMAVEPMQLVWISAFQAVTFPLITICSKVLIDDASPVYLRASGQQISAGIYFGISALITPVICGVLGENFSHNFALLTVAAICVVPVLLIAWYNKTQKS